MSANMKRLAASESGEVNYRDGNKDMEGRT